MRKFIMLGSGTSSGVPRIGNDWGSCDPQQPYNRRSRASGMIIIDGFSVLIDTGPDLRQQMLSNNLSDVNAVIWTHDHADHCHGIDDLRPIRQNHDAPIMGYASKATAKGLKHRFSYIFESNAYYPAMVELNIFSSHKQKIGPATISTIEQPHGPITSSGIIIEHKGRKCVYAVDFSEVTPAMVQAYHGADLLIVDALREAQHPTHAHLDMALTMARKVQAKHAILTHLDKSMDYERISAFLPSNVEMGYDGMIMPW